MYKLIAGIAIAAVTTMAVRHIAKNTVVERSTDADGTFRFKATFN